MNSLRVLQNIQSWLQQRILQSYTFGSQIINTVKKSYWRRVPVMLQLNAVECGAACLAMILGYYGRKVRIADCNEFCNINRDGTSAQTIAQTARKHGLRARAYSVQNMADFKYVRLPAIGHWNFKHFVVIEHWSPKRVTIVDPAVGRLRVTADEFKVSFTGVLLTFEPDIHFVQHEKRKDRLTWQDYLWYLLRTPGTVGLLVQIIGASLILQLLGLALPVFTKVIVDDVIPFRMDSVIGMLGLGMITLLMAQTVTHYFRAAFLIYLQGRLDSQLMLGFFQHLLKLPFRFFQERTSGDLLMRLGSNTVIREILTNQVMATLFDGTFVLIYLLILLTQDVFFGILVFCISLVQVAILLGTTKRIHTLNAQSLATQADSQGYLVEALQGIMTLKATGSEERALEHWTNLFYKQLNVSLQKSHLTAIVATALMTLHSFSPLILLWVGALRVLDGAMSLGTMLAFNSLAMLVLTPLASLVSSIQQLQLVGSHLERISDVIETEPEQNTKVLRSTPLLTGKIELKCVSFRYNSNDTDLALRDISISIQPGQKVAIVGCTGSGKTTLAMLLLGFYAPTDGEILFDNVPLQRLDYRTLRNQFGVVLQQPFLFSGSIRKNIALNNPGMSIEQVMKAAQLAAIHKTITQMPMGYETLVTEGGSVLSGGQIQQLALARALVNSPAILLLDEATSDLDVMTEQVVDQNLSQLICTRIVIAHRLSTVRNADIILVLNEGNIVEQGSHTELIAQGGYYASLIHSQLIEDRV